MKHIKVIFLAVFVFVTIVHLLLVLNLVTENEDVVTKKETLQSLDLRNVAVVSKPKPKPVVKPKPKLKPKPVIKPKPTLKPEPIKEQETLPELVEEEKVQELEEVDKEPVEQQPKISASEAQVIKSQYITEVKSAIEQRKYYPKKAKRLKHEGVVKVRFKILKDGSIKDVVLDAPSKYKRLNEGALKTLKNVGKFNPIPAELGLDELEIVVPIEYRLR